MAKRGSNKTKRGSNKTIALYLPYQGWQPRHDDSGSKMLELGFVTVEGAKVSHARTRGHARSLTRSSRCANSQSRSPTRPASSTTTFPIRKSP